MNWQQFPPHVLLRPLVECIWIVEGYDTSSQKILPDGHTELIFHFGDRYNRIDDSGRREIQSLSIAAGQLRQPIHLHPSGYTGMIGIKFKPVGLWQLFGWNMQHLTNETASLDNLLKNNTKSLIEQLQQGQNHQARIHIVENFLLQHLARSKRRNSISHIAQEIDDGGGQINIRLLAQKHKISERTLERSFNEQVGLSAKLYSRVVRFTQVFKLIQQPELSKAEATYLCGFFDQSHFNKEFKAFSGEDPGSYFLQHHHFSNSFMNR
ncbi:MAG: DUF6597 domain-containing transcriptional factor [Bacteroidota bacterium]